MTTDTGGPGGPNESGPSARRRSEGSCCRVCGSGAALCRLRGEDDWARQATNLPLLFYLPTHPHPILMNFLREVFYFEHHLKTMLNLRLFSLL